MGICVLGDKVIVSATPNILVFTKDDDDKILKKEALFTKSGQVQHDHSLHSFTFGPDGKFYWNVGNTGNAVHDKDGKPVVTVDGNVVNDKGKPYRQGMVFLCDPDGSQLRGPRATTSATTTRSPSTRSFRPLVAVRQRRRRQIASASTSWRKAATSVTSTRSPGPAGRAKRTNMEAEIPAGGTGT